MNDYLAGANRENFLVVQIEEPEVIAEIDAIAGIPGVDVLFVGLFVFSLVHYSPLSALRSRILYQRNRAGDDAIKAAIKACIKFLSETLFRFILAMTTFAATHTSAPNFGYELFCQSQSCGPQGNPISPKNLLKQKHDTQHRQQEPNEANPRPHHPIFFLSASASFAGMDSSSTRSV